MAGPQRSILLSALRRMLARGRGEARALEQALHLQNVVRFVGVFAITILLPSLLLAYYGISSIRSEELEVLSQVQREAEGVADAFAGETERSFNGFERAVRNRLEAGRSPIESPGELHRHLLVALRFSEDGTLLAPFAPPRDEGPTVEDLFLPEMLAAVAAETARQDPVAVARLYSQVGRATDDRALRARARFDRARMLVLAGRERDAETALAQLAAQAGDIRDPWGMRIGDLARLQVAELYRDRGDDRAEAALRALVDELLARRWTVGDNSDGAIARRALSRLTSKTRRDWLTQANDRVAERTELLFWASQLLPELEGIVGRAGRTRPGTFQWRRGSRGLWALTWWDGDLYAFGLDHDALLDELKADARGAVLPEAHVSAFLAGDDEDLPEDWVERRSLAPWMPEVSLVVEVKDLRSLQEAQARSRRLRIAAVFIAVFTIAMGIVLAAVLINRELDVARMKTDFAASVSHELRSPITQIRLKGELLMMGILDEPEEMEEAYVAIVRESERLSRLVDNVLDFAAIERGAKQYTLRPGDLAETVYRSIDSIASAQEVQGQEIDIDLPYDLPPVHHDSDAIAQCVINLVSNAAKYSPQGSTIKVTGRVVDDANLGRCAEIAISDQGIGIAPHDLQRIFEPFYRSPDSLARRRKGTGIGLTITKYIIDSHGGQIGVQSRPGRGSTFTIRLPLTPSEELTRTGRGGRTQPQSHGA